jgi:hypothetical protein
MIRDAIDNYEPLAALDIRIILPTARPSKSYLSFSRPWLFRERPSLSRTSLRRILAEVPLAGFECVAPGSSSYGRCTGRNRIRLQVDGEAVAYAGLAGVGIDP